MSRLRAYEKAIKEGFLYERPCSVQSRPVWLGPWRRDERARCWWRPYWHFHHGLGQRALFDDGTRWA